MAEDKTGWSEKGKRNKGDKGADGADSKDAASTSEASSSGASDKGKKGTTPSRPSKRQTDSGKGSSESSVVRTPSSDGAKKVAKAAATAGQRDVSFASRLGFPALIALICILGVSVVVLARVSREALAEPSLEDHWHSVYGVYNCNSTVEGDAKYLAPFQSTQDLFGIHSHGDGLIHIHPFVEAVTGDRAQLSAFLGEMNVEVDTEQISIQNQFDAPLLLEAGNECADGTGAAEIKVLRWQFAFQAYAEDRPDPEVVEGDPSLVNFRNDSEVIVIAYIGENTDLADVPSPPADRFDLLGNVSNTEEYDPTVLNPVDSGSSGIEVEVDDEPAGQIDALQPEDDE